MSEAISSELVERMVALVRNVAAINLQQSDIRVGLAARAPVSVARAIVDWLPEPVDPDLIEARDLIADAVLFGAGALSDLERPRAPNFRAGECDSGDLVSRALAMIKRGRELAKASGL